MQEIKFNPPKKAKTILIINAIYISISQKSRQSFMQAGHTIFTLVLYWRMLSLCLWISSGTDKVLTLFVQG